MAGSAESSTTSALFRTTLKIEKSKINSKWIAFRNSVGVAVPLAVGIAIGNPLGGVAVCTGALNVSYSDGPDPYTERARRMLLWSILGAIAVFLGCVTGHYHWAVIGVAMLWAFGAGMALSISQRAGDLGLNSLVALIVYSVRAPLPLEGAFITGLLVLGGGLLQTLIALSVWWLRRYEPERRAISELFRNLASELDPAAQPAPMPLSAPTQQVQDTLAALGRDHSLEGERFRLLFDQADRIRISAFVLQRLRRELQDASTFQNGTNLAGGIDELLGASAKFLASVSECMGAGTCATEDGVSIATVEKIVDEAHAMKTSTQAAGIIQEIAAGMDVLAGQLRSVSRLTNSTAPQALEALAHAEDAKPWRYQIAGWLATIRANMDSRAGIFRHAVRLAVSVAVADLIGLSINWQRSYWLPMTVAVILKPDFTTTFSRGLLRLAGTFGGLALATALFHLFPASALTELFLVGAFMFALRWLGPANYGIFSVAISGLIVFLVAVTGIPPTQVVAQRALNTVAGGLLALIFYTLWPTWERRHVSEAIADMLNATRDYFKAVASELTVGGTSESELDRTRGDWRRLRSNAEASVDRSILEPNLPAEKADALTSILASSHAIASSLMALEAGLADISAPPHVEAFGRFGNDVDLTLYVLSARLRGSRTDLESLPKLREDYRELVNARQSFRSVDEFLLLETDRITVAINTLREQVMRFTS